MRSTLVHRLFRSSGNRLVLMGLSLLVLAVIGCERQQEPATRVGQGAAPDTVTFCHGSVTDILPRIAMEMGFFADEGLKVTLKDMSDGKEAFENLLTGECDFAVNGVPPIALHDPKNAKFTILATVMSDDDSAKILARRDHGITSPQDLRGKRIGVKKGIIGHLFLDLFMMKHGLTQNDVILVDMATEKFQDALLKGEIDGFAMTNKLVNSAALALGGKATLFAEPGLNTIYGILSTRSDIPRDLKATPRVLKALTRAEQYARSEPAAAKALVAKASSLSAREIEDIWASTAIEIALANSLFVRLEDQYKWQVERGFAPAFVSFPNYLAIVSPDYLRAIKPESVSVIK